MTKYELQDYKNALSDADRSIYLMPNNAKFYVARGLIKERLLDRKGACIDWRFALSSNRGDAKDLVKKYCQSDTTSDNKKGKAFERQDGDAYSNRGISKRKLKDYYGAISDYTKAIEIDPNDADLYVNRSIAKDGIGDIKSACVDAKKAVSLGDAASDKKIWINDNC